MEDETTGQAETTRIIYVPLQDRISDVGVEIRPDQPNYTISSGIPWQPRSQLEVKAYTAKTDQ